MTLKERIKDRWIQFCNSVQWWWYTLRDKDLKKEGSG